jgi:hypothetical protein
MAQEKNAVDVVRRWHEALNGGDLERFTDLHAQNVEFVGPRGSGRGAGLVRDWAARSGIRLEPLRRYGPGEHGALVVTQLASWRDPGSGEVGDPIEAATVFQVVDGLVTRIARFDTLSEALLFAEIDPATLAQEMTI